MRSQSYHFLSAVVAEKAKWLYIQPANGFPVFITRLVSMNKIRVLFTAFYTPLYRQCNIGCGTLECLRSTPLLNRIRKVAECWTSLEAKETLWHCQNGDLRYWNTLLCSLQTRRKCTICRQHSETRSSPLCTSQPRRKIHFVSPLGSLSIVVE